MTPDEARAKAVEAARVAYFNAMRPEQDPMTTAVAAYEASLAESGYRLVRDEKMERLQEALREDRDKWSFDLLMFMGQRLLDEVYPADIFVGPDEGELGDPGPRLIAALRACAETRLVEAKNRRDFAAGYAAALEDAASLMDSQNYDLRAKAIRALPVKDAPD